MTKLRTTTMQRSILVEGMPPTSDKRIEDYALVGDCQTAALIGRDGSIDWLCLPRFDSGACFAALLGLPEHGRWKITPRAPITKVERRYRGETLVLETELTTEGGTIAIIDFMPPRTREADLVRIVEGRRGRVEVESELLLRFDYGSIVPWTVRTERGFHAVAGPDAVRLRSSCAALEAADGTSTARFVLDAGSRVSFDLTWWPSFEQEPPEIDPEAELAATERFWTSWTARCQYRGPAREAVVRSLVTLKALTYAPTGGIIAAPTTSLPEAFGGVRNWDYRFCWLRDATFTLLALLHAGYHDEARAFREWLVRAVAGSPKQIHIMYGIAGERRLPETTLDWLPGFDGSQPVRIGNEAYRQRQLDVYGEVMDTFHHCWRSGIGPGADGWRLESAILDWLEGGWQEPDEGIWEVRGPRRHFTHSKVMAWVAVDRAVHAVERFGLGGPVDRWRALRAEIHAQVCRDGWNDARGTFVQAYGETAVDASLLMIPIVGFLPASDPRVRGTIAAIERELLHGGFVHRYLSTPTLDGLPSGEAAFLLCSFWYADVLALAGRLDEARTVFDRLLSIRNDVGLLAEGYDVQRRRLAGNFPQAFSHVGLIGTARALSTHEELDRGA
jgi:GH15 family glucan-1,4-alpha-glucosidase